MSGGVNGRVGGGENRHPLRLLHGLVRSTEYLLVLPMFPAGAMGGWWSNTREKLCLKCLLCMLYQYMYDVLVWIDAPESIIARAMPMLTPSSSSSSLRGYLCTHSYVRRGSDPRPF